MEKKRFQKGKNKKYVPEDGTFFAGRMSEGGMYLKVLWKIICYLSVSGVYYRGMELKMRKVDYGSESPGNYYY